MNNKNIFSWIKNGTKVKETKKYGRGIYATEEIKKGEVVAALGGHVFTIEQEKKLPSEISDNGIQIADDLVLGIINKQELEDAIYFNHSCNPCVGIKGQIFLVAMKTINPGDQITFDYAMTLGGNEKYEMECLCGSNKCRKFITNNTK